MGRSTALRTVGMAVMYSEEGDEGACFVVVGRDGVERERRAGCWGGGASIAVAVAEEAVVEDWDCGEGREASSWIVGEGWGWGCGWPNWTSWAVKDRGRVCVARSKPATTDSRPD